MDEAETVESSVFSVDDASDEDDEEDDSTEPEVGTEAV